MTSLFLDTSYNQILGLLSDKLTWTDMSMFQGQKLTGVIHRDLNDLLIKNSKKLSNISKVIYCAGPGFYTGLRVAFGIADIIRMHHVPVYSLYNFQIPQYCGIRDYIWITKAYRGEIFIYESKESKISLVAEKTFFNNYKDIDVFSHSNTSVDDAIREKFPKLKSTEDLLIKYPTSIFSNVVREEDIYYFRPLDEEYKPSL